MANPFSQFTDLIGFETPDLNSVFGWVKTIGIIIGVAIIAAIFVFLFFRYKSKKGRGIEKEIWWWEETPKGMVPLRRDKALEVSIPGTHLKLFHIKKTNTWLPRFTRGITPNVFYVAITQNREIVNFALQSLEDNMKDAGLIHDHTDMRWAAENLREFVKRNYRDKASPWWKEYQGVISTAIFIVLMTASLGVIIYLMRGVVQDIGGIAAAVETTVDKLKVCAPSGSGVIQQGTG